MPMTVKLVDRHSLSSSQLIRAMPSVVEEKGNIRPCNSQYLQVKQIHRGLTETISEMKSIDSTSTLVIDQLKVAQAAVEKACTLLTDSSQRQLAPDKRSKHGQQPTMLEPAELFQQWQAKRGGEANHRGPDEVPA